LQQILIGQSFFRIRILAQNMSASLHPLVGLANTKSILLLLPPPTPLFRSFLSVRPFPSSDLGRID
jgi:hypothetical protein